MSVSVSMSLEVEVRGVGWEAIALLICSTADIITEQRSLRTVLRDSSSVAMVDGVVWPIAVDVTFVVDWVSLDVSES